jgi:hypothetical protein
LYGDGASLIGFAGEEELGKEQSWTSCIRHHLVFSYQDSILSSAVNSGKPKRM